jgi:hypothetical protein
MTSSSGSIDSTKKWSISLYSAILFFVIASPMLFVLVNSITSMADITIINQNGCPNLIGLVLHSIVFLLITRLSMEF